MGVIQEEILDSFFSKLSNSDEFDETRIARLKKLFESTAKPKATAVTEVLTENTEDDLE